MDPTPAVRLDKWLWAVRLYKTRTLAAKACLSGKVSVQGLPSKPSRTVRVGDIFTAVTGELTRTVKVRSLTERRVGAALVPQQLEDLTPATEYARARQAYVPPPLFRPKGSGRPTKKERRSLESLLE